MKKEMFAKKFTESIVRDGMEELMNKASFNDPLGTIHKDDIANSIQKSINVVNNTNGSNEDIVDQDLASHCTGYLNKVIALLCLVRNEVGIISNEVNTYINTDEMLKSYMDKFDFSLFGEMEYIMILGRQYDEIPTEELDSSIDIILSRLSELGEMNKIENEISRVGTMRITELVNNLIRLNNRLEKRRLGL